MGWDYMEEPPRTHVGKRETVGGNQLSIPQMFTHMTH